MNKMRFLSLLYFLDSTSRNLAVNINVFEFVENKLEPTSEFSSASLANKPLMKIPEHFILCSSHFQSHFSSKNTNTIYVLYEDEHFSIPWFNVGFWTDGYLWANLIHNDHSSWQLLGHLEIQDLFQWIHICLDIDLVNETISTSINGKSFGATDASGIKPLAGINFNIRLGIVHHTSQNNTKFQFYGKITNIQLYVPIVGSTSSPAKTLCINRPNMSSILSWSDMKWSLSGEQLVKKEIDTDIICPTSPYADLKFPFKFTKSIAVDVCNKLGKGKLSSFLNNSSRLDLLKDDSKCFKYWTPYLYIDGKVRNFNTKLEGEFPWWPGFPVNIANWSNILFYTAKNVFANTPDNSEREECLICNSSLKSEYILRGNCKYSILGNFNYKANTFKKYLGFFGKRVTIW